MKKGVYIIGGIILAAGIGFGIYKMVSSNKLKKEKENKAKTEEANRVAAAKLAIKIKDQVKGYMTYDNPHIQSFVKEMQALGYTYDQKTGKAVKI